MQFKLKQIIFKVLIPTTLVVFLVPTFVLALSKEIQLLWSTWLTAPQTLQQPQPLLSPNSPEVPENERLADLIDEAVKEEVRGNFDLTLNLINLLLAALAVIPILSGVFLWTLKRQIESELTDRSGEMVRQKIGESEQLAKQKVQDLIDARAAELETLKIDQILRLINFSIKEDIHPMIEKKYQQMFRLAFIEGFPSEAFVHNINRETKLRLEDYVKIFRELVKSYPDFFQTDANDYVWLADACFILGEYEDASRFYAEANDRDSYSFRILHRLGNGHLALKHYSEAIHDYTEAIRCTDEDSTEFRPERHAWLHHNLGKAHDRLYNYEEAIQNYRKAYQYNPNLYHSHYWEGNALSGLGRFDEAIDCFEQADQILQRVQIEHPIPERDFKADQAWIFHGLGDACRKMGDACHQVPHNGTIRCDWFSRQCDRTTACQQRLEHYQVAIDYYNEAEKINGSHVETLHKRGKAYRELGDYEKAEADYSRAVYLASEAGILDDRCNLLANRANLLKRLYAAQSTDQHSAKESAAKLQEADEQFALALKQCQERRLRARADSADVLEKFYSYFDTARCLALKGEVKRADEYWKNALTYCPPDKQALVQQWVNSDSDFNNWYWYVQSQNHSS